MESNILELTIKEAKEVAEKLSICEKGSEKYAQLLQDYKDLMRMIVEETSRLNSIEQLKQKDAEIAINADIEDRRLKQNKYSWIKDAGLKVLGGAVMLGVNIITIMASVRINNSGETLTSFENKFIFPDKFR